MYKVYGDMKSGNCYKIRLLLDFQGIKHEWQHVDVLTKQTHSEAFKAMNPNAKIPVMDLGDGTHLWESNAILNYLAEGTPWLPEDRLLRALVLQWQFFEQYSHEPFIATARFINKYLGLPKDREAEYHAKQAGGNKALAIMDAQLAEGEWLVGVRPTIADITLFAYTHVADEGGFSLETYPNICRWLDAIRALPGYVSMDEALAETLA